MDDIQAARLRQKGALDQLAAAKDEYREVHSVVTEILPRLGHLCRGCGIRFYTLAAQERHTCPRRKERT